MPKRKPGYIPPPTRHAASGQGRVRLSGRDHYLGHWLEGAIDPPLNVQAEYKHIISRWLANDCRPLGADPAGLTVSEVLVQFWTHAEEKYSDSQELASYKVCLAPLRQLFGKTPADDFGPKSLKAVRQRMIEIGWCRNTINRNIVRVRSFFRWAESEELVSGATYQALLTVEGLSPKAKGVTHTKAVEPATDAQLQAVLPFCSGPVAAMLQLQFLAGMRSAEVRLMRTCDVDTTDPACWVYRPSRHKNQWRGQGRAIALGPKCIELLRPWLLPENVEAFLFSPQRAVEAQLAERRRNRTTPLYPSHVRHQKAKLAKRATKPKRPRGLRYSAFSYPQALRRACRRAKVAEFHPYQLRHGAKMRFERELGSEAARAILGHKSISTTTHYGTVDLGRAVEAMKVIG